MDSRRTRSLLGHEPRSFNNLSYLGLGDRIMGFVLPFI